MTGNPLGRLRKSTLMQISAVGLVVLSATTFPVESTASARSGPFVNAAAIAALIKSFTSTLTSKGEVDLSSIPGFANELLKSPGDHPSFSCVAGFQVLVARQVSCVMGDVKSRKVLVVFGDSHAWQWIDVLSKVATARKWKLVTFTKEGCPDANIVYPVPPEAAYPTSEWNKPYVQCQIWRNSAFSAIAAIHPYLIVSSGQDHPDATPSMAKGETDTLHRLIDAVTGHIRRHVLFIEDVPRSGYGSDGTVDSDVCLAASGLKVNYDSKDTAWSFADNPNVCYRSFFIANTIAKIRSAENSAASKLRVRQVDPRPWICNTSSASGLCPPVIGNVLTYFDSSHITDSYAYKLANLLGALLPAK